MNSKQTNRRRRNVSAKVVILFKSFKYKIIVGVRVVRYKHEVDGKNTNNKNHQRRRHTQKMINN